MIVFIFLDKFLLSCTFIVREVCSYMKKTIWIDLYQIALCIDKAFVLYISILVVYCRTNVSRNYHRSILLFEQKREQNFDSIADNGESINTHTFKSTGKLYFYYCTGVSSPGARLFYIDR